MIGLICLLVSPLTFIWSGFVLSYLWLWFVVPVFDAPALSLPVAIGINLIAGYLTHRTQNKDSRTSDERCLAELGTAIFTPALYLLIGYIVKGFL